MQLLKENGYYNLYRQIFELESDGKLSEAGELRKSLFNQVGFDSNELSLLDKELIDSPEGIFKGESFELGSNLENYNSRLIPVIKNIKLFLDSSEIRNKKFRKILAIVVKYSNTLKNSDLSKLPSGDLNLLKLRMLKALSSYITHVFIEQEKSLDNVIESLGCLIFIDVIKDVLDLEAINSINILVSFIRMIFQ